MDTSQIELPSGRRTRRRHPADFKQGVIQACMQPGVSIAAIALANGLNTNMVRKWVIDAQARQGKGDVRGGPPAKSLALAQVTDKPVPSFMALPVAPAEPAPPISIEITRGATALKVSWPSACAGDCALWLRELLR